MLWLFRYFLGPDILSTFLPAQETISVSIYAGTLESVETHWVAVFMFSFIVHWVRIYKHSYILFMLLSSVYQLQSLQCMPAGAVTLIACLLVDFCIYEGTMPATLSLHSLAEAWGKAKLSLVGLLQGSRAWPCPPWNFFRVNVLMQWANLYGVQPWHWNFTQVDKWNDITRMSQSTYKRSVLFCRHMYTQTILIPPPFQGLPVMLGLYTPLLLYGMCCTRVPPIVKYDSCRT